MTAAAAKADTEARAEAPTAAAPSAAAAGRITDALLKAAVWGPPVGVDRSDFDMSPGARAELPPGRRLRPAAVLCALAPRPDGFHVILTRRADHLKAHAGQIAFPGGKVDPTDRSPLRTALREAREEIGLAEVEVDVIGAIERYETRTGYRVTPFVGITTPTYKPFIDHGEVAEIFEVPLDFVMDPKNIRCAARFSGGKLRPYLAIPWRERYIWGATAGMLNALADRIASARAADPA